MTAEPDEEPTDPDVLGSPDVLGDPGRHRRESTPEVGRSCLLLMALAVLLIGGVSLWWWTR